MPGAATCGCSPTAGPSSPRIIRCRRSGNTPSWSPPTGVEVLTLGSRESRRLTVAHVDSADARRSTTMRQEPRSLQPAPRLATTCTSLNELLDERRRLASLRSATRWKRRRRELRGTLRAGRARRSAGARSRAARRCDCSSAAWQLQRRIRRRRPGADRRRRLRPRRAAPVLRHRRLHPAAQERFAPLAAGPGALPDLPVGHRPGGRSQRAHHRRLPAREPRGHQVATTLIEVAAPGRPRSAATRR